MNNSLSVVHPELIVEWSKKNLPLTPDGITFGSNKVVWWKGSCGHEWQTSVKARPKGEKCPICSGARAVAGINDLSTLKPGLASEWSKKNEIKPTEVTVGSHKKVIWKCRLGHEWTASVKSRSINGSGCPYCSHNKVLVGFNDLATVVPKVADEWSEKNEKKPTEVTAFANRKAWWKCRDCDYEWNTLISTRSGGSNWDSWNEQQRKEALRLQKDAISYKHSLPSKRVNNEDYKSLVYCRYADDFLIGVIGSFEDASEIKDKFRVFLEDTLHLEMSEEKTKITHSQDKARFLGYDITTAKNSALMYDSKHQLRKTHTGRIKLYAPRDKWQAKLIEYGALRIRYDENGKEIWDSHHRGNMVHMTDVEIVSQVNAEIRGMYNYYSIAENATVIKNFAFILEYSMYKTFGLKYQKSVYKIQRKYRRNGIFMVPYNTKKGLKYCEFYHDGFKKKRYACSFEPDLLPQYVKYDNPNYLRTRIKLGVCELCGENTGDICMHHVKSLKSIKADNEWNTIMLAKRRKTLAVCPNCYAMITK